MNDYDWNEFQDLKPYDDRQAAAALAKVADHKYVPIISKALFPAESPFFLRDILKNVHNVGEFQYLVMSKVVDWVIENTTKGFTYDGLDYVKGMNSKYLVISNHRDIIMDPAFLQYVLFKNNMPLTQIAVGSNLITGDITEYLLRSNRMIKVIRGISARELYLSSQHLSKYIRQTVTSGESSVWIAQRQGRAKNGLDITEQGLLKMLDMSGEGDFRSNFKELNIIPMCISYEYEPCDIKKARELLISRTQEYVKKPDEDMHSIMTGIRQRKGHVHLTFGRPLSDDEIEMASYCSKNDRYQWIRSAVDRRVVRGYKLWKTNYMAYDIVNSSMKYSDLYTSEDLKSFKGYVEHKLDKVEKSLNRDELRDIFLRIYSNPVEAKLE